MVVKAVPKEIFKVVKSLVTEDRFSHMSRVAEWCLKIAASHGLQDDRLVLAAFSHDMFRDVKPGILVKLARFYKIEEKRYYFSRPVLLHGPVAAKYMKRRFGIDDEVFEAVYYHTSGTPKMRTLGKILVIADVVEQSRDFPQVDELRKLALAGDLDEAYRAVIKQKALYALEKNLLILPETTETWNEYVERGGNSGET
ncbi:MAG: bis(5'-nucleosyl)-tetraphosphatase (symmetrical) YqeK [Thermotogae bacterium]|nr:bis(5'-nucleosyl)-tetraphosphatase (symmetrical) YqeK [Thermotogota bacterium]